MREILQKTLEQITEETGLVGAVVALMKDGKVTFTHTYGYADREQGRPVTEESFFDIASCSKAWTTMLAAQACDEGILDWDTPVQQYIPEFTMHDPYVGAHVTPRDLASHRTGMPGHDFMREKIIGDRENLMRKTAHLELNAGLRSTYQYNNHMYIVLGYLLERIRGGKCWEEQILEKIAGPLGVDPIRFRGPNPDMTGLDCALPYVSNGFVAKRCGYASNPYSAPCGGIKINIKNLCKWVGAMSMGGVTPDGTRLCSEKQFAELIAPTIPAAEEGGGQLKNPCYALAWINSICNGKRVLHHSGGLTGFNTQVGFLPEEGTAYAMIFNTGSTPAVTVIRNLVLDYLTTGKTHENYDDQIEAWKKRRDAMVEKMGSYTTGDPMTKETNPELIGSYRHPAYETFEVEAREDGRLWFVYGDFQAPLQREASGLISAYTGVLDGLNPDHIELYPNAEGADLKTSDSELHLKFVKE